MTLKKRLDEDLKNALRARDELRKSVLRFVLSALHNREIEVGEGLDDEGVLTVLSRQAKQRRESIDAYTKGNRPDLVEREEAELQIILQYLPAQMSADEITRLASQAVADSGATGPQDMGKVMGRLMPAVKDKADGKAVSGIVARLLSEL